jgi:DNA-binding NarL/FixJ family response regulator
MKLLLMDDHPLMLKGLATLLTQAGATVLTAETPQQALVHATTPDLAAVLMDWKIPGMDSPAMVCAFAALNLPVVVVSGSIDANDVRQALVAGALGFVPKSASPEMLLGAVHQVLAGNAYVPVDLLREIAASVDAPRVTPLTGRQLDVLRALAQGQSNKVIGRTLDLSDKTIKAHVTAIFRALGVVNRTQAITRARELGWLDQD